MLKNKNYQFVNCLLCVHFLFALALFTLLYKIALLPIKANCTVNIILNVTDCRNMICDQVVDLGTPECPYIEDNEMSTRDPGKSDISVIQLNIRGLLNKQDQIKDLMNKTKADIVLLCETWLRKDTFPLVNIESHKLYNNYRTDRLGGGVGILVNRSLRSRLRNELRVETEVLEHTIVELKTDTRNILLVSGYRPPNSNVRKFIKEYKMLIKALRHSKHHSIVIGIDHNLDLMKVHKHAQTNEFLEVNLKNNLMPCVSKPTRITTSTATLIDNIFISERLVNHVSPSIIVNDMSDHLPIHILLKDQKKCVRESQTIKTRAFTDNAVSNIKTQMTNINWKGILEDKDVNTGFDKFHDILITAIDRHAPEKEKRINYKKIVRDPWITTSLMRSLTKQKKLYKEMLESKTEQSKQKYKQYRNTLKRLLRHSRVKYIRDKCEEYKQNSKKLWQMINRIIGKEHNKRHVIDSIKTQEGCFYDPDNITSKLCEHFANIGEKYSNRLPTDNRRTEEYINKIPNHNLSIFLLPTTQQEIKNLILTLSNKPSSGYDNISNILLKRLATCLLEPLEIIFNKSLYEGVFPEKMKLADIIPLHKAKSTQDCNNYRPISLLITISKLLEKIIYTRTYGFLEKANLLYTSQYGFREGHSCENAVSELISEVIKSRQEGLYTMSVFLDLSKAFDTLEHNVLLKKLEKYGIRGKCNKWFKSYLENRKIRVKCAVESSGKTEYSEYRTVTYGTPQGSCLGPLIFIIFTNDLYRQIEHSSSLLFADDTTLYKSHRNLKYLTWCLEDDLKRLVDWFSSNKLTLNIDKTVCILFQKPGQSEKVKLEIGEQTITNTADTKFLGMFIDEHMNWSTHINNLVLKITRNSNMLKLNQTIMPTSAKLQIYQAHIASHIQYCILIWGNNASEDQVRKIQKIQNTCMRYVLPKTNTTEIYKKLKVLKITSLIELANLKFSFKLVNDQLPTKIRKNCLEDSQNHSLVPTHSYNTRNKRLPNLPKKACKLYKESFLYKAPRSILNLNKSINMSTSFYQFKKSCKNQLLINQE